MISRDNLIHRSVYREGKQLSLRIAIRLQREDLGAFPMGRLKPGGSQRPASKLLCISCVFYDAVQACIREEDTGKCPNLTITRRSDGIGFTFRSSLFWFSPSGPSVLAPILFVLSLLVDIPIVGPVQRAPDLISILVYPLLLGLTCWPFLWLHGFARDALIEDLTPLGGPYRRLRDGSPSEPCSQPPITQVSI